MVSVVDREALRLAVDLLHKTPDTSEFDASWDVMEAAARSVLEGEAIWFCRSNDKGAIGSLDRCEWTSGPDHFERCGRVVVVPIVEE